MKIQARVKQLKEPDKNKIKKKNQMLLATFSGELTKKHQPLKEFKQQLSNSTKA